MIKISLINTNLEINLKIDIRRTPKVEKLKKELTDFFSKNQVLEINIKEFDVRFSENNLYHMVIFPEMGGLKFGASGLDYSREIQEIGEKYNLEQLRFSLDCYGK